MKKLYTMEERSKQDFTMNRGIKMAAIAFHKETLFKSPPVNTLSSKRWRVRVRPGRQKCRRNISRMREGHLNKINVESNKEHLLISLDRHCWISAREMRFWKCWIPSSTTTRNDLNKMNFWALPELESPCKCSVENRHYTFCHNYFYTSAETN